MKKKQQIPLLPGLSEDIRCQLYKETEYCRNILLLVKDSLNREDLDPDLYGHVCHISSCLESILSCNNIFNRFKSSDSHGSNH